MLRLSTKGRYGARVMLDLAMHYGEGYISIRDIARRQGISEGYLEHLLTLLRSQGLVSSSRGVQGGYMLKKPPREITLGMVIQALEGTFSLVECVTSPSACRRADDCVTREIWVEVNRKMSEVLDAVTLQDMVQRTDEKRRQQAVMYEI